MRLVSLGIALRNAPRADNNSFSPLPQTSTRVHTLLATCETSLVRGKALAHDARIMTREPGRKRTPRCV